VGARTDEVCRVKRKKNVKRKVLLEQLLLFPSVMYGVRVNLSRGYVSLFLSSNDCPVAGWRDRISPESPSLESN
jgi:hypothetical protein